MKFLTVSIAALLLTVYCFTFWAIAASPVAWVVFLCIALNALSISILFVIGHDAGHHALFGRPWQNDLLAQVCFLPALQPLSAWQMQHNVYHHGFAGLRTKDPAYPPATLEEYSSWILPRKVFYRFKRSVIGFGFLYLADGWGKTGFSSAGMKRKQASRLRWEVMAVAAFVLTQMAIAIVYSTRPPLTAWSLCVAAPFLIWNYSMSFVTYLHHTNPQVPWFDNYAEWRNKKNYQLTVHVKFPKLLDLTYLNIMQHPAHHDNARTAWHDLPDAQTALAQVNRVVELPLNPSSVFKVFKLCKLYDTQHHCWRDYTGAITSKCLII